MKRLIFVQLAMILALSLVACTGVKKGDPTRVKCPACGYEFEIPARTDPGARGNY